MKVTIDQPDAESAGSAVAFVEGRMNCAAATAVMDMKVRLQMLWLARGTRREAWHRVCRGAGLRWRVRMLRGMKYRISFDTTILATSQFVYAMTPLL